MRCATTSCGFPHKLFHGIKLISRSTYLASATLPLQLFPMAQDDAAAVAAEAAAAEVAAAKAARAQLWSQAIAVHIKSLIPVVLDISKCNYTHWRTLFEVAVGKFELSCHLTTASSSAPLDADWKRMDYTILSWIYGFISQEILGIVMAPGGTTASMWQSIENLFRDNKTTRAMHLQAEFSNLVQGDLSATEFCHKLKTLSDALRDVDQPVIDQTLVLTMIKGMNPKHKHLSALLPMMSPFPSFIQARSLLLLDELNDDTGDPVAKATALVADSRSTPAPATYNRGGSRGNGNGNNGKKGKGKGKQGGNKGFNTNSSPLPLPAQPHWNPWTGQIQLWPTAGLLGPRPGVAPRPAPPQADMGVHQPMQSMSYNLPPLAGLPMHAMQHQPPMDFAASSQAGAPSTPTWDTTSIANSLNAMTLQQPSDQWYMDTGATAHMSSGSGLPDQGSTPSVQ
ncbi:uncharacterized protein LOC133895901 [Phragmites australis]|uniref:uncharacterized protein LOC133895901 n=1 Tax=Phragmites australis TaxID=29695 RepID=UPI002D77F796|nr:uncharacterized protein LOC133895901 [Phragmites australis]